MTGERYEGYQDGARDGDSTSWDIDGTAPSASFRQDERHGARLEWHAYGRIYKGFGLPRGQSAAREREPRQRRPHRAETDADGKMPGRVGVLDSNGRLDTRCGSTRTASGSGRSDRAGCDSCTGGE